jgi:predicted permease
VTAPITLPGSRYGTHARATAFFDRVYEQLRSAPGIRRVAATSSLPFAGADSRLNLEIENRIPDVSGPVRAHPRLVSPDYFSAMGIRMVSGRPFTDRDREQSGDVAIVNETAVRRYWSGADPIGQRISLGAPSNWREVVGVVSDTRQDRLDMDVEPAAYLPQGQAFASLGTGFERSMTIVVRTAGDTAGAAAAIRSAVARVDSQLPLGVVRTMTGLIDDSVAPQRLNFMLVSAFAGLAVLLTGAGLYGVMAYIVAQRTREIGVRMALGASPHAVLLMMLREGGAMTAAGIAIGLGGALMLSRFLATLLFAVSATDPVVYAAVVALLGVVALAAVAVPSSRATRVDPLVALRDN